jgi:Holliday junction resolvasome RuvABC endonuclease subunit
MLLAIDPGMNSPGAAIFGASGLVDAGRVSIPSTFATMPDGARWMHVAACIVAWTSTYQIDAVVYERPQWYQRAKSKGDPNQLVGVAGVAANVTGMLWRNRLEVRSPTPAEWVGQLSKVCPVCKGKAKRKCLECHGSAWETPRGRRIHSRLTPAEIALVPDQNDAIDAVGIGLWALGRLEKISVFSNGRDGR